MSQTATQTATVIRLPVQHDETALAWFAAEAKRIGAASAIVLPFKRSAN